MMMIQYYGSAEAMNPVEFVAAPVKVHLYSIDDSLYRLTVELTRCGKCKGIIGSKPVCLSSQC